MWVRVCCVCGVVSVGVVCVVVCGVCVVCGVVWGCVWCVWCVCVWCVWGCRRVCPGACLDASNLKATRAVAGLKESETLPAATDPWCLTCSSTNPCTRKKERRHTILNPQKPSTRGTNLFHRLGVGRPSPEKVHACERNSCQ